MKILLIHTYYHIRGGEDQVFEQEHELLMLKHEVRKLSFQNSSGFSGLLQFLKIRNNNHSNKRVEDTISEFQPDVIHIHNLHFAGGYGIINIIQSYGIPIVMTLHNYRFLCPSGILFDGKEVYLSSLKSGFPWDAVFKGLYKKSVLFTFWLSYVTFCLNRNRTLDKIDKYIVLTDFAKNLYVDSKLNIDSSKFIVKPNFVKSIEVFNNENYTDCFLFVGRLSEEKGLDVLLEVITDSSFEFEIAGVGPLVEFVEKCVKDIPNRCVYHGRLSRLDILQRMKSCSMLILPSTCYEGMPMTIIEAFSVGLPVIANNLGAMKSIIEDGVNGFLYDGTKKGLLLAMDRLQKLDDRDKFVMRQNAYQSYLDQYTANVNLERLEEIYSTLIHEKSN